MHYKVYWKICAKFKTFNTFHVFRIIKCVNLIQDKYVRRGLFISKKVALTQL